MEHIILNSEAAAQAGYIEGQRMLNAGQNDILLYTGDSEGPGIIDMVPPTGSSSAEVDAETLESARALGLGVRGIRIAPREPALVQMVGLGPLPRFGVVGMKHMPLPIVPPRLVTSTSLASWQTLPIQLHQQQHLQMSQEPTQDLPGVPYVPGEPRRRGRPLKLLSSGGGTSGTSYVIATSTDMSKLDADYVPPSGHSTASSSRGRPRSAPSNKYNTRKRNTPQWSKILASEDGEEEAGANDMGYPIYVPLRPRKRARIVKRATNEQPAVQYILPRKKTVRSVALNSTRPMDEPLPADQLQQLEPLASAPLAAETSALALESEGGGSDGAEDGELPAGDDSAVATAVAEVSFADALRADEEAHTIVNNDNNDALAAVAAAASSAEGNVEVLVCDFCLPVREFSTQPEYEAHVKELHQDPLRPFVCGICNGQYARKLYLNVHMGKHNDVRPWKCKLCPAAFKYQCSLITHRNVHEGIRYECPHCDFTTAYKAQLGIHLKFHNGQAMRCPYYETDGCTYLAVRKQNMDEHLIKHTQEKRALCEVCGAKFRSEKNKRRHMLMHTDLRPFRCMLCSFATTRWDKLREHSSKFHQVLLRRRDVRNIEPGLDLNNTLSNVTKLATNAVLNESGPGPSELSSAVPPPGPPPLPLPPPLPQYADPSIAAEMDAQRASDEAAANAHAAGADEVAGSVMHLLHCSSGADEFGQSPLLPSELGGSNVITVNPPSHYSSSSTSAALNASDMTCQQSRMFSSSSTTAPIVIKRPQGGIIQKIPILSAPVPFLLANSQTEEASASDLDAEFAAAGPSDVHSNANSSGPTLATITTPIQSAQLLRDPQTGQLVMEYRFPSAGLQRWHNILKKSNIEPSDAAPEAGEEGEEVEPPPPPRRRARRYASRVAFAALAQSDEGEPLISEPEHEVEGAEVIGHLHDLGDEELKTDTQRQREDEAGLEQKPEDEEPDMDLVARKCHKCPGCCSPSEKKRQHRRRRPPVQQLQLQQLQLQQPLQQYASMPPAANTFLFSTEQETRITPRDKANISNVDDIFIYQEQEVAGEETVPGASQLQQLRSAMRALPGGQEVAIVSPPSEGQLDPGQGSREIHVHTSTECTTLRLPTQAYQEIRILGNQIVIQLRNEDYTVHLTDLEGLPTQA